MVAAHSTNAGTCADAGSRSEKTSAGGAGVEGKGHGRLAAFQAKLLLRGLALLLAPLLAPLQPCLVSARRRTGQVVPDADKAHVERTPADARTRLRIEVVTAFNEGDAGGTVTHHAARVPHTV